ncbi:MAG: hypothetical protein AAF532_08200 [Planctomycetota bacterium]
MQVTLPDDWNLEEKAAAAGFDDVPGYIADLIERAEIRDAIRCGLEAIARGNRKPGGKAFQDIRRRTGSPEQ